MAKTILKAEDLTLEFFKSGDFKLSDIIPREMYTGDVGEIWYPEGHLYKFFEQGMSSWSAFKWEAVPFEGVDQSSDDRAIEQHVISFYNAVLRNERLSEFSTKSIVDFAIIDINRALGQLLECEQPYQELAEKLVAGAPQNSLDELNEYMQSVQEAIADRKAQIQHDADSEKADTILKAMGKTREELLEAGIDPVTFVNTMLEASAQSLKKEPTA